MPMYWKVVRKPGSGAHSRLLGPFQRFRGRHWPACDTFAAFESAPQALQAARALC
jgi:hypothetical protein